MLDTVLIALSVTALTILVHALGTAGWLAILLRRYTDGTGQILPRFQLLVICATACVLIALHFVEILFWALVYLWVTPGEFATGEAAVYFSAVTFTTLGYGDITLSADWRLLSGFEAINGIVLIGWTTAFLFSVLQRSWNVARRKRGSIGDEE